MTDARAYVTDDLAALRGALADTLDDAATAERQLRARALPAGSCVVCGRGPEPVEEPVAAVTEADRERLLLALVATCGPAEYRAAFEALGGVGSGAGVTVTEEPVEAEPPGGVVTRAAGGPAVGSPESAPVAAVVGPGDFGPSRGGGGGFGPSRFGGFQRLEGGAWGREMGR